MSMFVDRVNVHLSMPSFSDLFVEWFLVVVDFSGSPPSESLTLSPIIVSMVKLSKLSLKV